MSDEINKTIENESADKDNVTKTASIENAEKTESTNKVNETKKANKNSSVMAAFVSGLFKILAIVVIAFIIMRAIPNFTKKQTIETKVTSVLENTKTISELQTLIVPYNSVLKVEAPKKKETDEQKYEYVVAYHGSVTFGIDFKKIAVSEDAENKKVIVTMPKISIIDTDVDPESVETIYLENKKADQEFAYIERRKQCKDDLDSKANNDEKVMDMAKKTAESTIRNLLTPFIKELYPDYELVIA